MKKIPSLFMREGDKLTREFNPAAAWVVSGEGVATRKFDGTAVMVKDGALYARYDAKRGKPLPDGFLPCQEPDLITGHHPGWVLADRVGDKWIREAARADGASVVGYANWTYEACGPKIGTNAEGFDTHLLIRHGAIILDDVPRDHEGLCDYLSEHDIEGVVWWRNASDQDCDKVKITGPALGVGRRAGKR